VRAAAPGTGGAPIVDPAALVADTAALVRVPSVTGDERAVMERLVQLAGRLGLEATLVEHDLAALRAHPDHPGEEAPRSELVGVEVIRRRPGAPRLALCGHLDVVGPGDEPWDAWSGRVAGGWLHGRGAADMKGAVAAALHALAAVPDPPCEVALLAVASEEDGGLGAFAALERDAGWSACLIPEPTAFDVACAQAGALTFAGRVPGVAAHAAVRREGISAIDRYVAVHHALAAYEERVNAAVEHPLMGALDLPYPLSVGRVAGGRWSSTVPDVLEFEGRVGVPVGGDPAAVRAELDSVVRSACPTAELRWTGGQFAPGETAAGHPFAQLVLERVRAEAPGAAAVGVPYGADMRLFCARGIPCVMAGTPGLELAHARDERVGVADLSRLARIIAGVIADFGG
jgi:acetylornithine deacetylase